VKEEPVIAYADTGVRTYITVYPSTVCTGGVGEGELLLAPRSTVNCVGNSVAPAVILLHLVLHPPPLETRENNTFNQQETRNANGDNEKQILFGQSFFETRE
jgi:hypothetical protein